MGRLAQLLGEGCWDRAWRYCWALWSRRRPVAEKGIWEDEVGYSLGSSSSSSSASGCSVSDLLCDSSAVGMSSFKSCAAETKLRRKVSAFLACSFAVKVSSWDLRADVMLSGSKCALSRAVRGGCGAADAVMCSSMISRSTAWISLRLMADSLLATACDAVSFSAFDSGSGRGAEITFAPVDVWVEAVLRVLEVDTLGGKAGLCLVASFVKPLRNEVVVSAFILSLLYAPREAGKDVARSD